MTSYDEYLAMMTASVKSGCEYIPKLCYALREEDKHLSNDDIKDKVTKDCLERGLAKGTIINNIPEEFKDPKKVEAGKKGAEKKKEMQISNTGQVLTTSSAEMNPVSQTEPKSGTSHKDYDLQPGGFEPLDDEELEDDPELQKKMLAKKDEIIKEKDEQIADLIRSNSQLGQAIKKDAFKPANKYTPPPSEFNWPEPDESNTFVWKAITFDDLRKQLGPLKASGNTKINVYLERVT